MKRIYGIGCFDIQLRSRRYYDLFLLFRLRPLQWSRIGGGIERRRFLSLNHRRNDGLWEASFLESAQAGVRGVEVSSRGFDLSDHFVGREFGLQQLDYILIGERRNTAL